jgi:chromosome segregation ATPase
MADELAKLAEKITNTEVELEEVKAAIKIIQTGDDAAVEALVKKLRFRDGDEALKALRADKARLDDRLNTYETRLTALTQQQQHSGAGTSMLPVHQEVEISPCAAYTCRPCSFSAPRH